MLSDQSTTGFQRLKEVWKTDMNQDPITPDMNAEIRRLRCIAEDKSHNEKLVHRSLPPFPVTDRKYTKTGAQNTTAFLIRTTT